MYTIEFSLRGNDPNLQMLKSMVEGIANQLGDPTAKISEKKLIVVSTENSEVAAILNQIVKNSPGNKPVAKRGRKSKEKKLENEA